MNVTPELPVVVVTAPACHYCDDALDQLGRLTEQHRLTVREVEITCAEGARMVAEHRPALTPLVLVDGKFFSAGRLPRRKLEALLRERAAHTAPATDEVASRGR